jgi:F-type H+-transporting ATPase subunit epsilon
MQLEILTPDKTLFSGEVESVTVPGSKGKFQILNGHAALVSSLDKGSISVQSASGNQQFEISGGVIEVLLGKIIILV